MSAVDRIEALRLAHASNEPPEKVVERAKAYLAFLDGTAPGVTFPAGTASEPIIPMAGTPAVVG